MTGARFIGATMDAASLLALDPLTVEINQARLVPQSELRARLVAHHDWIDSLGRNGVRLDLSHCDLRGLDLSGANLSAAVLRGSLLSNVTCARTRLLYTDLTGANLCGAKFRRADLRGANFSGAFQRDLSLEAARIGAMPYVAGIETKGLRAHH
jgi:uncharacterized protein YjbI with pentapeptide repeats